MSIIERADAYADTPDRADTGDDVVIANLPRIDDSDTSKLLLGVPRNDGKLEWVASDSWVSLDEMQ
jgi:hypothetical protein